LIEARESARRLGESIPVSCAYGASLGKISGYYSDDSHLGERQVEDVGGAPGAANSIARVIEGSVEQIGELETERG
jgi:hypothetical protein